MIVLSSQSAFSFKANPLNLKFAYFEDETLGRPKQTRFTSLQVLSLNENQITRETKRLNLSQKDECLEVFLRRVCSSRGRNTRLEWKTSSLIESETSSPVQWSFRWTTKSKRELSRDDWRTLLYALINRTSFVAGGSLSSANGNRCFHRFRWSLVIRGIVGRV